MKILKLTHNEILKQVKKLGFRICLIILFSLAILYPILTKTLSNVSFDSGVSYYEEEIKYLSTYLSTGDNYEDKLNNEIIELQISYYDLAKKEKIDYRDYREYLIDNVIEKELNLIIVNRLINGEDYSKIEKVIYSENKEYNTFFIDTKQFYYLSKEDLPLMKESLEKDIKSLNQAIKENDYSYVLKTELNSLEEEAKFATDKDEISFYELKINLYKQILTQNIKSSRDFRIKELQTITDAFYSRDSFPLILEKDYNKEEMGMSYKVYNETRELNLKTSKDTIAISEYAIMNNIDYKKIGARTNLIESSDFNVLILLFVTIVIAGGVMSFEFQTGTIRLLVIRPNKRFKIILSKLLAILIILTFMVMTVFVTSFIATGIVYGFSDYAISHLSVVGNKVVESSFILFNIKSFMILLIPVYFVSIFSFAMSTITTNTAFSVGLGIFLALGNSLILQILHLAHVPFLEYTFLPYLGYSAFLDPYSLVYSSSMFGFLLNFTRANITLLSWGIVLYLISNFYFIKKDIKN